MNPRTQFILIIATMIILLSAAISFVLYKNIEGTTITEPNGQVHSSGQNYLRTFFVCCVFLILMAFFAIGWAGEMDDVDTRRGAQ